VLLVTSGLSSLTATAAIKQSGSSRAEPFFSCRRLDRGGGEVVSGSRRDLFVLVEPRQCSFQLTGCSLQLKTVDDFVNGDACEGENAVLLGVAGRMANHGRMVALEVFGKDVCVQDGFDHRSERGHRFRWPSSFLVGDRDNLIKQRRILWTTE
jgi:hypothetical protein